MPRYQSVYKSEANEAQLMKMYDRDLQQWPVDYSILEVPTRYGKTHIVACGSETGHPVMLIHAMGLNATMWMANVQELSKDFRVLAIDTIGDLGKSRLDDLNVYPRNGADYSNWLTDICDSLSIERAHVIGSSMGGWITLNHAVCAPERVKKVVLLGPQGIAANLEVLFRLFSMVAFPTLKNKKSLIDWILGSHPLVTERYTEYMLAAMSNRGRLGIPVKVSNADLQRITAPMLLFVGGQDPTFSKKKDIQRVKEHIADIKIEVMPEAGHLMSVEQPVYVNERIMDFLTDCKRNC